MTYVRSDIDNNYYLVRCGNDKEFAANFLARIKDNIFKIVNYLNENKEKYPDYIDYINQLASRIKNVVIHESSKNSVYTSYSINKGEELDNSDIKFSLNNLFILFLYTL